MLDPGEVRSFVREQVAGLDLAGRSLCVVIPDGTRNCPLPLLLQAMEEGVGGRASTVTAVVALGTHAPMSDDAIRALVGPASMPVRNHAWWEDDTFTHVGGLPAALVEELSGGRLHDAHRRPRQPAGRRERRDAACGPGAAPRGHRLLGRQQVPLPRPLGSGDDRRDALARRTDHEQRDHRHAGHHAGAGAGGRGGRARARRAPRAVCRRGPRQRRAGVAGLRRARRRPGPQRPRSPRRRTSSTSTARSGGCCR